MGLLSPWFLAGLGALSLPLWLHLLRRHRMAPKRFSSLMFFERRTQSSIKRRRLHYIALLAARLALLALLALAFADPYVMRQPAAASGSRAVVIAIDNSFSMREGTRLERAKREALGVLSGVKPGDRVQVLSFSSAVRLMHQDGAGAAELKAAVDAVRPGDGRSSYGELARALRSMAQSARVPLEVHLFSDMQRSSMPPAFADLRLGEHTRLVPHPAAAGRAPNWAVETVTAPRRVFGAARSRVQATVAGYGAPRARRTVSLVANGKVIDSKTVEVPENGRATVEFLSLAVPHGFNRCEVRIDAGDTLRGDDRFLFPVENADPRPALFVYEARRARAELYFRTALESAAGGAFKLEAYTPDQLADVAPSRYAFVVLSDPGSLPPAFENALASYLKGGGALLTAVGPVSAARGAVAVLGFPISESVYSPRAGERFQTASAVDAAHPVIHNANRFEGVKFYQAYAIQADGARVLARLSGGAPLLIEQLFGEGRALVFASTFDSLANDFPLHSTFVPFVERTAAYLSGYEDRTGHVAVDAFLELRSTRDRGTAVEVLDPDGRRALSLQEAASTPSFQADREGFYEIRRANGRRDVVAANADRKESDLDVIPEESLALWRNTGQGAEGREEAGVVQGKPWSLWWYVMIAVLGAALAESFVASRYMTGGKEAV